MLAYPSIMRPLPGNLAVLGFLGVVGLTACAAPPAPEPAEPAEQPAPAPAPPVPSDSRPVPSDTRPVPPASPRLLAADIADFAALAGGTLLIEPDATWPEVRGVPTYTPPAGFEILDPTTGARRPFPAPPWRAEGWKLRRDGEPAAYDFEVSRDGRWVALAYGFEVRPNPALFKPDLVAFVVTRSDGSDPRCVGVAIPSDDPPPFAFSSDGRLIGDWGVQCSPGPHGAPIATNKDGELDAWPRLQQWYRPDDATRGEVPELQPWWYDRDPLGDIVAMQTGEGQRNELELRNFATGARVGAVPLDDRPTLRPLAWVSADMLLAESLESDPLPNRHYLVTTDGRTFPAPHTGWRVYTRLPDGAHLFSRDAGATIEQGRVDWPNFTVTTSRRRPDVETLFKTTPTSDSEPRRETTWTPGLGGVLILDHETRGLYLAAI